MIKILVLKNLTPKFVFDAPQVSNKFVTLINNIYHFDAASSSQGFLTHQNIFS